MSFFDKLFRNKKNTVESNKAEKKLEYDFTTPGLSQRVTFGCNGDAEVAAVVLNKPVENLHKVIVNHNGCFENFPGIIQGKWTHNIEGRFNFDAGHIGFRTSFEGREGGGWRCLWEIQPDGRYWADEDGFGAEDDAEIILYADLDGNGEFITPFRIYSVDARRIKDPSVMDMEIDAECTLKQYTGADKVVVVPEGIKKIGTWAFASNETVKEIKLPNTLTEISNGAFERSTLECIMLPDGVSKMGYCAFYACRKLESITLPDTLTEIASSTFGFCESLKTINLPHMLKTVDIEAFECSGIEEISLPEGMISVGQKSFTDMNHLKKLHLPSTLKYIGENAFSFCSKLEVVNLPEGLLQISRDAFDGCNRLEKVSLPSTLIELAPSAFSRTLFAKSVDIKALAAKINDSQEFPLPRGFKEMTFNGLKLQYTYEEIDYNSKRGGGKQQLKKTKLEYIRELTDDVCLFENADGVKAIMLYESVPTFDFGDREWDGYRKLFLVPTVEGVAGFKVCGGYKIDKIYYYQDIFWGNEKTKRFMEETGVF